MLQEKVLNTIKKHNLIQTNDKIVIAVSGGPDSMCLLDILNCLQKQLKIEIIVAHINHMIRKEADKETAYVQKYCKKNQIPFYYKKVDVIALAKEKKLGTEEMGRKIRYEFFEEIALKTDANKIATAHNSNDNAETLLLNLLRGTGISGLKGIECKRESYTKYEENNIKISYIRPIINCNRFEIEEYCEQKKLNPQIDKSNLENDYTRNKVRNSLIPYLQKEFNPNIIDTLNRLSDIVKEEENYFENIIPKMYETLKIGENKKEIVLDLKQFNILQKALKTRIILHTINIVNGNTEGISKIHIEDIIKLCQNNIGNKYLTPNKHIKVFVQKGKIYFNNI